MKYLSLFLLTVFSLSSVNAFSFFNNANNRVPFVFTGNSSAPEYQHYDAYKYKKDSRDSRDYSEYYLISDSKLKNLRRTEGIRNIHVHVRDIARDGLCGEYTTCFRAYVFANGDERSGVHLATFVVSPGTGRRTPLASNMPLRVFTRSLTWYEKPTQFGNFDMYRVYGSKSYPGDIANMPNAIFYMNAIAIHGSFGAVNGNKQSHGCIRMNPDESYWLQSLVREARGNFTIDVLHTR